jgi:hypothetical protein
MSFEGIGCGDMGLIQLAQDMAQSRDFVYVMTKYRVSYELGNISTQAYQESIKFIQLFKPILRIVSLVAQSVYRRPMGWTAGVRFPTWKGFSSSPYRLYQLWSPPGLLANRYRRLFLWGQSGKGVKLATHHLVPRSRMVDLYIHFLVRLYGVMLN